MHHDGQCPRRRVLCRDVTPDTPRLRRYRRCTIMSSMHTQALPPRKALLIAAQDMPVHGLRDGLYLVTPDMAAYDALDTRSVAACRMYGTPMPYATSPTTGGARAKGRTRAV